MVSTISNLNKHKRGWEKSRPRFLVFEMKLWRKFHFLCPIIFSIFWGFDGSDLAPKELGSQFCFEYD